jgi:DNA-binding transcriptional regulator YhcF (GntR family)
MIEPDFLASLRQQHYASQLLLLVQLEQVTPGYWLTQRELADQLNINVETMRDTLRWLRDRDLVRFTCTMRGTWVWWVARNQSDRPDPALEPCWLIRNAKNRMIQRVALSKVSEWAKARGIHKETMKHWLMGTTRLLDGRWELAGTPMDTFMPTDCEAA